MKLIYKYSNLAHITDYTNALTRVFMSCSRKTRGLVKRQLINNSSDLDFRKTEEIRRTWVQCSAADGELFVTLLTTAKGNREPRNGKSIPLLRGGGEQNTLTVECAGKYAGMPVITLGTPRAINSLHKSCQLWSLHGTSAVNRKGGTWWRASGEQSRREEGEERHRSNSRNVHVEEVIKPSVAFRLHKHSIPFRHLRKPPSLCQKHCDVQTKGTKMQNNAHSNDKTLRLLWIFCQILSQKHEIHQSTCWPLITLTTPRGNKEWLMRVRLEMSCRGML